MLFLSAVTDKSIGFTVSDSLLLSLIGFAIVFSVLLVLIIVIRLITVVASKLDGTDAAPALAAAAPLPAKAPAPSANAGKVPAPGSIGECDLHSVDDQTAAMLMAIVADNMNAPLNELRFLSIKELGEVK